MADAYMVKVTVGNNMKREAKVVESTTTLRKVLTDAGVDYTNGITTLDGSTIAPGGLDKTFGELGITRECFLLNVVKADNAA